MQSFKFITLSVIFLFGFVLNLIILYQTIRRQNDLKLDKKYCDCPSSANNETNDEYFRIVNGSVVNENEFSWIVSVFAQAYLKNSEKLTYVSICTGSVINPLFVVVASHCIFFIKKNVPIAYVAAGLDHNLLSLIISPDNFRTIYKYYYHPKYFQKGTEEFDLHDIGLVEIEEPFEFGKKKTKIMPGCFIDQPIDHFENLIAAGYGNNHPIKIWINDSVKNLVNGFLNSDELAGIEIMNATDGDPIKKAREFENLNFKLMKLKLNQKIVPISAQKVILNVTDLPFSTIFASSEQGSVCTGDSGGPLMNKEPFNKYNIVGILNIGFLGFYNSTLKVYCLPNAISVYLPIAPFIDWIGTHVGENICLPKIHKTQYLIELIYSKLKSMVIILALMVLLSCFVLMIAEKDIQRRKKDGELDLKKNPNDFEFNETKIKN